MKVPEDGFELNLTQAMKRVEAPAYLLATVMEAAGREESFHSSSPMLLPRQWQRWIGSAAASLLLVGVLFGGLEHHRTLERQRAERDFAQTLQITDRAMEHARHELQRAGIALDE